MSSQEEADLALARRLQAQWQAEEVRQIRNDEFLARKLQGSLDESPRGDGQMDQNKVPDDDLSQERPDKSASKEDLDPDLTLALEIQAQLDAEDAALMESANAEVASFLPEQFRTPSKKTAKAETSIVDPEWEDLDPTPDLHALFLQFNSRFFWSKLSACEVKWAPRMTRCAGVCSYSYRAGFCSIRLSVPLLKLRPRRDLVETLLHEMIHAYLFITDGNDDHDGHGKAFHSHMYRINKEAGTKISVYHNFHDEVAQYQTHWWQCDGPCRSRPPYFGLVKRSMNRAPSRNDRWFPEHQANCGGNFIKIKEPEGYGQKKPSKRKLKLDEEAKKNKDIRSFIVGTSETKKSK